MAVAQLQSSTGFLRRAGFQIDGRQAYALESEPGLLRMYVTAQSGVNLEPYVNREVELIGPVSYRGELRNNFMPVARVRLIR